MKKLILVAMALSLVIGGVINAQPGPSDHPMMGMRGGNGPWWMDQDDQPPMGKCMAGLDLDKDQQAKMDLLIRDHQRAMLEMRGNMGGLDGKVKLLLTDEKFDSKKLDKLVDEMSSSRKAMMKAKFEHVRKMRDILTADQKVQFDKQILSGGQRMGKGFKKGPGRSGHGKCCPQ